MNELRRLFGEIMNRTFARMMFVLWSAALAGCATPGGFYPVSTIFIPEGYTILAVLRPHQSRERCEEAVRRFSDSIVKGCADCRVDRMRCERELSGVEGALARAEPVAGSVVETDDLRMLITGPAPVARAACEQIAASSARAGVKSARCRNP